MGGSGTGTVATAAGIDLITLAEARVYPGLASVPASEDSILSALITAASGLIEKECSNTFVNRTFTEDYTYEQILRNPNGKPKILLRQYPIVSVTSITDPKGTTVASTAYWIDKRHGWLITTGAWDIPQDTNGFETYWTIVYIAGRFTAVSTVDANLKLACKMLLTQIYSNPDQNIASKSVGDLRLSYMNQITIERTGGLSPMINSLLAPYKRRDV